LLNRFGGLKWLTREPGMPLLIKEVVQELATLREPIADAIVHTVQANLLHLIQDDQTLSETYAPLPKAPCH